MSTPVDRASNVDTPRLPLGHTGATRPTDYVYRPEQSFPGLSFRPSVFVANTALARVPRDQFYLFGGFLRSAWTREPWGDVNVAFRSEAARAEVVPYLEPATRVSVAAHTYPTAAALLDDADFTVGQLAWHDGQFVVAPLFFEHLGQRLLVVNHIGHDRAAESLFRALKYVARGYSLPLSELVRLLDATRDADLSSASRLLPYAGGVVV